MHVAAPAATPTAEAHAEKLSAARAWSTGRATESSWNDFNTEAALADPGRNISLLVTFIRTRLLTGEDGREWSAWCAPPCWIRPRWAILTVDWQIPTRNSTPGRRERIASGACWDELRVTAGSTIERRCTAGPLAWVRVSPSAEEVCDRRDPLASLEEAACAAGSGRDYKPEEDMRFACRTPSSSDDGDGGPSSRFMLRR